MSRRFNIGDRIICTASGVVGKCIKFYVPTACEEQTMVITDDGRKYHAPTKEWRLLQEDEARGYVNVEYTEHFEEGRFFPITKALKYQE